MEMQMEYIRKLPEPQELMEQFPMDDGSKAVKRQRDEVIQNILAGKDDRFLLIIGPCSADNERAVLDYIRRLVKVQEQVKDKIFIIPRVYTSKPRTIGVGYKGMLHQPDPEGQEDMLGGIMAIRELNVRVVRETGFTCAEEILYPEIFRYLSDLLSYAAVGARSVEDQVHRMIASGVGIPVGMKIPRPATFQSCSTPLKQLSILKISSSAAGKSGRPETPWLTPFFGATSTVLAIVFRTITTKTSSAYMKPTANGISPIRQSSSMPTMPIRENGISNRYASPKTFCKAAAMPPISKTS